MFKTSALKKGYFLKISLFMHSAQEKSCAE
jgi:hypothetical protein